MISSVLLAIFHRERRQGQGLDQVALDRLAVVLRALIFQNMAVLPLRISLRIYLPIKEKNRLSVLREVKILIIR